MTEHEMKTIDVSKVESQRLLKMKWIFGYWQRTNNVCKLNQFSDTIESVEKELERRHL